ncbi:hypothetical protein EON63_17630, partial [archaeon]
MVTGLLLLYSVANLMLVAFTEPGIIPRNSPSVQVREVYVYVYIYEYAYTYTSAFVVHVVVHACASMCVVVC